MNPSDALTADRRMYYNNTWMLHKGVPRKVQVASNKMYVWIDDDMEYMPCTARSLKCWWPRAGAYNTDSGGVYIARRGVRNMRKSATQDDHYFVKYGYTSIPMETLRDGPNHYGVAEGIDRLANISMVSRYNKHEANIVAVSRDILLVDSEETSSTDTLLVIYRGLPAGRLTNVSTAWAYEPSSSCCPLAGRVTRQLERA
jgi:hypothetical protein